MPRLASTGHEKIRLGKRLTMACHINTRCRYLDASKQEAVEHQPALRPPPFKPPPFDPLRSLQCKDCYHAPQRVQYPPLIHCASLTHLKIHSAQSAVSLPGNFRKRAEKLLPRQQIAIFTSSVMRLKVVRCNSSSSVVWRSGLRGRA